jgi:hypothetical protein
MQGPQLPSDRKKVVEIREFIIDSGAVGKLIILNVEKLNTSLHPINEDKS